MSTLLIGQTGSGKSRYIHNEISKAMEAKGMEFILIDLKRVELVGYTGKVNLKLPIVLDMEKSKEAFVWLVSEIKRRKEIKENLPKILVAVDEFADLMLGDKQFFEEYISFVAREGGGVGVTFIITTSRLDFENVITDKIKDAFSEIKEL